MANEQKICYQFCSAITNLALALNLLIYHSTILKFWGGGNPRAPPCMKPWLAFVTAVCWAKEWGTNIHIGIRPIHLQLTYITSYVPFSPTAICGAHLTMETTVNPTTTVADLVTAVYTWAAALPISKAKIGRAHSKKHFVVIYNNCRITRSKLYLLESWSEQVRSSRSLLGKQYHRQRV